MRRDGKKIKVDNVEYALTPHIMPQRNDALNFIEVDCLLQPMQDYLNLKRKIKRIKRILTHCEKQSGCIGCKYEDNCDASYNFNNWILEIIKDKKR